MEGLCSLPVDHGRSDFRGLAPRNPEQSRRGSELLEPADELPACWGWQGFVHMHLSASSEII